MAYVTEWCPWSKGATGGYDIELLIGSRIFLLMLLTLLQSITLVYTLRQVFSNGLDSYLKICIVVYHVMLLIQYLQWLANYSSPVITGEYMDSAYSCAALFTTYFCPSIYITTNAIFWKYRLDTVFAGSVYQLRKRWKYLVYGSGLVIVLGCCCFVSFGLIEGFGGTHTAEEAFCVQSVYVIDFVPYVDKSWTKTVKFTRCATNKVQSIGGIIVWTVVVVVPFMHITVAFQYIIRMWTMYGKMRDDHVHNKPSTSNTPRSGTGKKLSSQNSASQTATPATDKTSRPRPPLSPSFSGSSRSPRRQTTRDPAAYYRDQQWNQVYQNGMIALYTIVTSLIAFVIYGVTDDANWVILISIDAYINGILMLAVCAFGKWIFICLCVKPCRFSRNVGVCLCSRCARACRPHKRSESKVAAQMMSDEIQIVESGQ